MNAGVYEDAFLFKMSVYNHEIIVSNNNTE